MAHFGKDSSACEDFHECPDSSILCTGFPETKPFESVDGKIAPSSSQWDKTKSNEVSVTFMLSSGAAKVFIGLNDLLLTYVSCWTKRIKDALNDLTPRKSKVLYKH